MNKLYNIQLVKNITCAMLEKEDIHETWAHILNGAELYATKKNNMVLIIFMYRKSICKLIVSKEFAKEFLAIIGHGVKNEEGLTLQNFMNQEENYLR